MTYNFDEIIDRRNTNSENVEGWRPYIFHCGPEKERCICLPVPGSRPVVIRASQ